jgi:hypothetical protein
MLLLVPVGVAGAIGFSGSVAGVGGGLDSLATGPESGRAEPAAATAELDTALGTIAGGTADAGAGGGGGNGDGGDGGGNGGGQGGGGGSEPPAGGTPGQTSPPVTGEDPAVTPDLPVVGGGGSGNPIQDILDGVNETVGGLLGGGNN